MGRGERGREEKGSRGKMRDEREKRGLKWEKVVEGEGEGKGEEEREKW